MGDDELRGLVLDAIYQRRRDGLINFDSLTFPPLVLAKDRERILSQLEDDNLIERTFRPLSGLGRGRITARGTRVREGKELSLLAIQLVAIHQAGTGNIQNVSVATEHSPASQNVSVAPKSSLMGVLKKNWTAVWGWIAG